MLLFRFFLVVCRGGGVRFGKVEVLTICITEPNGDLIRNEGLHLLQWLSQFALVKTKQLVDKDMN